MTEERTEITAHAIDPHHAHPHPHGWRRRTWILLGVVFALIAILVLPPLISLGRYQARITELISNSLGRPAHLSSVELRLLPRPAFVLYDLVVDEDPAYGNEPVLHANSVTASIRLLSLWRGKLAISSVSVDEASLNLVRTDQGRWNVDPFFRNATTQADGSESIELNAESTSDGRIHFPTLEATNSRINFKQGMEKLPFALTNTKLTFWQTEPGGWRVRLRGEPVRTDLSTDSTDAGELRLEATLHRAAELRQVPLQLEMEWRKAQLGQLTRLVLGADAGWRGDMTGNLSLTGTADEAAIKMRLRADNVHRAEFVPTSPMDFDANCSFTYHATGEFIEKLLCDSPLGKGQIHLSGNLHGKTPALSAAATQSVGSGSQLSVQLKEIPLAAGLDALRTIRAELLPGIEAKGTVSGELTYEKQLAPAPFPIIKKTPPHTKAHPSPQAVGPLTGALTIHDLMLSGASLAKPVEIAKIELEPVAAQDDEPSALAAVFALDAGAVAPVTVSLRLERRGYRLTARGTASTGRALQLTAATGLSKQVHAAALQDGTVTVDLAADGPWVASYAAHPDHLSGTATLHNTRWNAAFLVNPIELTSATLRFGETGTNWESASFNYGALKGTGSLTLPAECAEPCTDTTPHPAHFTVQLGAIDAKTLEASLLGAQKKETLLESLLAHLHPSNPPNWPLTEGIIQADSLVLGPVTLAKPTFSLRIHNDQTTLTSLDAKMLGGSVHATGDLDLSNSKPDYSLKASFSSLKPQEVGKLIGQSWSGASFEASGELDLQGFTGKDLATTAKGSLSFNWNGGRLISNSAEPLPANLAPLFARFDQWSGEATINNGSLKMDDNLLTHGAQSANVDGAIPITNHPHFFFTTHNHK